MDEERAKLYAGKGRSWKQFIYDGEKGTCFGRTGLSWCKIGVFYVIFYACLAGWFAVMIATFYQTLDTQVRPTYIPGDGSSILRNPAMGFRPLPRSENVESTLIWYVSGDNDDITHWTKSLDDFAAGYKGGEDSEDGNRVKCDESTKLGGEQVCNFKAEWFDGKCKTEESWGYKEKSPCIILKLNKMIGWEPDVYHNVTDLDPDMPASLVAKIKTMVNENDESGAIPKMIWVSCKGENPADEEYIGTITYSPWQGFPAYYFPFVNTPGYLAPVVAVQFDGPEANVLINIECRAWAKNIKHDRGNRLGLVHFELLRD